VNDAPFFTASNNSISGIDAQKFCDFVDPLLAAGVAIFLSIDTNNDGSADHWVPMVGYDRATLKYAYYDTWSATVQWADIYYSWSNPRKLNSINRLRTITYIGPIQSTKVPDIAADPASINFGRINVGTSKDQVVVLMNQGNADLRVSSVRLVGRTSSQFSLRLREHLLGFTVAPGDTHRFTVRFSPTVGGLLPHTARVSIASNDPDENPFYIDLSGVGNVVNTSAPIVVDGVKDAFYTVLASPDDGFLQIKSYAFNDNGIPTGDADLSAKVWVAWDADWFYLYEEVKDDTLRGDSPYTWGEDELELKIDPQPTDSLQTNLFDTRLTALGKGTPGVVYADSMNLIPDAQKKWARVRTADGYVLELAIKWAAIVVGSETITPSVGKTFGMAINQHDNDRGGRQATIQWAAVLSDGVWNNAKYHATVKFLDDHKLQFIAANAMTGVANPVPYDGTPFYLRLDGKKDPFYHQLNSPNDGYLQLKAYAYNDNGKPVNDADLSAKIWTAWDEDWFYLYEEVRDDTLRGNSSDVRQEDELEMMFDPQPTDSTSSASFNARLTAMGLETRGVVAQDNLNGIASGDKQWVRKKTGDGYILELAIRWSAITANRETIVPALDHVFGMAINQHDNDRGFRQATVQWAAVLSDLAWNTPKYLGTVLFLEEHRLQFAPINAMTRVTNPVPYDGTEDYKRNDGKVTVTFRAVVPQDTPVADALYLAGSMNFWDPGPGQTGTDGLHHDQHMDNINPYTWEYSLTCLVGQKFEYKYTRGAWSSVEKGMYGEEISNRVLMVPETDVVQLDTVRTWADVQTSVAGNSMQREYILQQNYPNPFNPTTTISYQIPSRKDVTIVVFNLQGEQVRTLVDRTIEPGHLFVTWDAVDNMGRTVPSGIYLCQMKAGTYSKTIRMILLK
jgi:hypothetical protein